MSDQNTEAWELAKLRKEIWEKAVDTQMHFNEMSVKSRQLGLSFVVGALGLSVVLLSRNEPLLLYLPFGSHELGFHVSGLIILIAAAGVYAVRRLDLGVYHQMLRGAVKFGEELEEAGLRSEIMRTPLGMTQFISLYSRHRVVRKDTKGQYVGEAQRIAGDKIARFYTYLTGSLVVIGLILTAIFFDARSAAPAVGLRQTTTSTPAGMVSPKQSPPSQ